MISVSRLRRYEVIFEELKLTCFIVKDESSGKYKGCICSKEWAWITALKSFEAIHGVYRIVKLIPGKLFTAIAIYIENLPDPKDNGSFLVDLVLNLITFYRQKIPKHGLDQVEKFFEDKNESQVWKQLFDNLETLSTKLETFKAILRVVPRDLDKVRNQAYKILHVADNLLIFCRVYLDFIHPILVQIERSGPGITTDAKINELRLKIEDELSANESQQLTSEFDSSFQEENN